MFGCIIGSTSPEHLLATLTADRALDLIRAALNNTWRSGLLAAELHAVPDTVVLGASSPLDSLAFVTFMTDLEDLVSKDLGRAAPLSVLDLPSDSHDAAGLTVRQLQTYLATL